MCSYGGTCRQHAHGTCPYLHPDEQRFVRFSNLIVRKDKSKDKKKKTVKVTINMIDKPKTVIIHVKPMPEVQPMPEVKPEPAPQNPETEEWVQVKEQQHHHRLQRCRLGSNCPHLVQNVCKFYHTPEEHAAAEKMRTTLSHKTQMCRYGKKCTRANCPFAHDESELRKRKCWYGDACRKKDDPEHLRLYTH